MGLDLRAESGKPDGCFEEKPSQWCPRRRSFLKGEESIEASARGGWSGIREKGWAMRLEQTGPGEPKETPWPTFGKEL